MTKTEFRQQVKDRGLVARKRQRLEVFDVLKDGTELFCVTFAELHSLTDINQLLTKKIRPEYIPPLG